MASALAAVFVAAVAVAAIAGGAAINGSTNSGHDVYAAETLPASPTTTLASTAFFDGINEGVIAIGAYK